MALEKVPPADKAITKTVEVVKPDEFTFYTKLPATYEQLQFRLRNKKVGPETKKVYMGIQSSVNRSIHLRRNYRLSAILNMEIRMYPKDRFAEDKDKSLYAFQVAGDECNSKEEVLVCFFPPYALDNETSISVRVYAVEVTEKEAKDVLREDKDRAEEQESFR